MSTTRSWGCRLPNAKVNWEEHLGLCRLAAKIAIRRTPSLAQHYDEIVCDLESKLWEICNPTSEKAGYDPSKGYAFSTYAMGALIKYCGREIKNRHLGCFGRTDRKIQLNTVSMSGEWIKSISDQREEEERERIERESIAAEIADMIGGRDADFLVRNNINGETRRSVADSHGMSKYDPYYAGARRFVANLKEHNPQKYSDCIEAIGGKGL